MRVEFMKILENDEKKLEATLTILATTFTRTASFRRTGRTSSSTFCALVPPEKKVISPP
jgi:hypothetical protein